MVSGRGILSIGLMKVKEDNFQTTYMMTTIKMNIMMKTTVQNNLKYMKLHLKLEKIVENNFEEGTHSKKSSKKISMGIFSEQPITVMMTMRK
jgi:hypothetical protein